MVGYPSREAGPMKLPRVRFTIWSMMAAIVVFAVAAALAAQASRLKTIAKFHESRTGEVVEVWACGPSSSSHRIEPSARAVYHAKMRDKYLGAARRPWLPVTPDPPEPE
jgi:hypothetical protein